MTIPVTLPPAYFDAMYQGAADPWGFEDRWYWGVKCARRQRTSPRVTAAAGWRSGGG